MNNRTIFTSLISRRRGRTVQPRRNRPGSPLLPNRPAEGGSLPDQTGISKRKS
ncbi:MAG TPA: hypothetical protein VJ417_03650 [Candidatus Glassbacteria bacterium]|nr:hypothetical protein [Candidatus Glassbacteria bacterium]